MESEPIKSEADQQNETINYRLRSEKRSIQYQVLKTFFWHREKSACNIAELSRILSKNFTLRMPITPYREFPANQVTQDRRLIRGIRAYVKDIKSLKKLKNGKTTLATFLRGLKSKNKNSRKNLWIDISYVIKQKDLLFCGNKVMGSWTTLVRSINNPHLSCQLEGMLQCQFNDLYRIVHLDIYFDVNPIVLVLENVIHAEQSVLLHGPSQSAPLTTRTVHWQDSLPSPLPTDTSTSFCQTNPSAVNLIEDVLCAEDPKPIIVSSLSELNLDTADKHLRLIPLGEYNGVRQFVGALAPMSLTTSSLDCKSAPQKLVDAQEADCPKGAEESENLDQKTHCSTPESSVDSSEEFQLPKSSESDADATNTDDELESISTA